MWWLTSCLSVSVLNVLRSRHVHSFWSAHNDAKKGSLITVVKYLRTQNILEAHLWDEECFPLSTFFFLGKVCNNKALHWKLIKGYMKNIHNQNETILESTSKPWRIWFWRTGLWNRVQNDLECISKKI